MEFDFRLPPTGVKRPFGERELIVGVGEAAANVPARAANEDGALQVSMRGVSGARKLCCYREAVSCASVCEVPKALGVSIKSLASPYAPLGRIGRSGVFPLLSALVGGA